MHTSVLPAFSRSQTALKYGLLLIFLTGVAATPQNADVPAEIDRIATQEMQKRQIPAMTVAVAFDGQVVYSKGFGIADIENSVAANQETLIRTGSLAKPLTAVLAMTLVEAGKLDLDAPIQRYCPAFPKKQWTITTRELLTHTAGIRHYKGDEVDSTKHYKTMSDGFAIFAADPLLFKPGTKFNYSTYGYTVAGCVIEGASGERYYDYLREHVLVPANMTHTFVDDLYAIIPHRARGYQTQNGTLENAGLLDSSYKVPGGGIVSTAEDFVRFGSALIDGKIVKPETLATIWTASGVPNLSDGKPATHGMGFGVLMIDGQKYIAHNGGQQGTSTDMVFIPGKRFAVAVFANDESASLSGITGRILDLYHMPRPH
jgi:serine beta-lactamase-like protein LACTB, mitochondrial